MPDAEETRLLALLVHRNLIDRDAAHQALVSGDPRRHLVEHGVITDAQWQEWEATAAGTRPELSRYELGDLLGEGGMARVFRAVDRTTGQQVALKVLKAELSKDATTVDRFIREARLLMELDHPAIVRGIRVAREGDVFFFAMEEISGECLQDLLTRDGRMAEADAMAAVTEVARALGTLHSRGLVHRDVKPGNIMWSPERGAVLIDLGFAVPGRDAEVGAETTAGTVHYIAPEQARGHGDLDVRADIYSLGATLYHLVTGSLPFSGRTSEEVLAKQVLESLSGERIRDLQLSPQVHYFIEKMMAKEKEIRFQDPEQLAGEIQAHLDSLRRERELAESPRRRLGDRGRRSPFGGRRSRRRRS